MLHAARAHDTFESDDAPMIKAARQGLPIVAAFLGAALDKPLGKQHEPDLLCPLGNHVADHRSPCAIRIDFDEKSYPANSRYDKKYRQ